MSIHLSRRPDTHIVLHDISWAAYERILAALGEYHLRHTYDQGRLEMRSVLRGVTWENYTRFLDALGDYHLRHTFDRGTIEMMSPRKDHDWIKRFVGRIIETVAFEFDVDIQCIGSTTVTSPSIGRGFQPDEAYYIASEPLVRGKLTYDPDTDPPPDLLVEIDVTSSSIPRMPGFAALRVPEVWRHDGQQLRFFRLDADADYREIEQSLALPLLRSQHINEAVRQLRWKTANAVLRMLIAELRGTAD